MSKARYEIKFVLNELEFIEAKYFLKYINSFRSFPQREVTSLYYDTLDYSCVRDNLSGISKRKKLRLRWYNNFEEPKLEIKNRFSRVGNKKIFTLDFLSKKSFENLPVNALSKLIFGYLKSKHKEDFIINNFIPTLRVSYYREYYETRDGLRITIDKKINFGQISYNQSIFYNKKIPFDKRIMELKFPIELKNHVNESIRNLNINPKRNSKLLLGMSKLGYVNYV